jgi:predicted HTH domain antitoxin
MAELTSLVPDSILATSGLSLDELVRETRLLLAARLFDLGRVSGGRAAELAGLSRVEFMLAISKLGVSPIQVDPADYNREFGRV